MSAPRIRRFYWVLCGLFLAAASEDPGIFATESGTRPAGNADGERRLLEPKGAEKLPLARPVRLAGQPLDVAGIYPHLAFHNDENECGTGAIVPWADRLWAITYAPHKPNGSSDKLYEITRDLTLTRRHESVGGTPANRMIHKETQQLLMGPYVIDAAGKVRVIPPADMYGRLTGTARHLESPAELAYYATMEEGLYEVNLRTLAVTQHIRDGNGGAPKVGFPSKLPGYHGKGLYSGQGRVLYSNNGEHGTAARTDPTTPSGALAEWRKPGEDWSLVRRNQFTEITGPGGIHGATKPETDPVWAMGWDEKSVLLALLEDGAWTWFRLPKASHSYDGAHGWNTEWPRIREIGEGDDLLATMHGTFWRFPRSFSRANTAGIEPRSNYLKVIGDFCRWGDRVVLGCDDSAKAEFLNTRPFKAHRGAPMQSNSNLWFVKPEQLDRLGPVLGRGSVWLREDVAASTPSDPYLFAGYDQRCLHLTHHTGKPVVFDVQIERDGLGRWDTWGKVKVPSGHLVSVPFAADEVGVWIRLRSHVAATGVSAQFHYRDEDERPRTSPGQFAGLARSGAAAPVTRGVMRSLAHDRLGLLAIDEEGRETGYYELGPDLVPRPKDLPGAAASVREAAQPAGKYAVDGSSILIVEDGVRSRLPLSGPPERFQVRPTGSRAGSSFAELLPRSLAKGAKVTAGSTHAEYHAARALDGKTDDNSRWISSPDGPKWLAIDLGARKSFRSVAVMTGWKHDAAHAARNLSVQVRDGKGPWQDVPGGQVLANDKIHVTFTFDKVQSSRELRLLSTDPGYVRVYEIAVFEEAVDIADAATTSSSLRVPRLCREVATERDLLNLGGTVYELPARNAFGVSKIRPVATHGLAVHDFCSHAGLLVLTGLDAGATGPRIFRSADGRAAVWAGVIDEMWQLGKCVGHGGPWLETPVEADKPSDRFLMTGYDRKSVLLSADAATRLHLEVDIDGTGLWVPYRTFAVAAGANVSHTFPASFGAYWVRAVSSKPCRASVTFTYE